MPNSICEMCGGSGHEIIGENRVTQDMAIDAGDPNLEGTFHSYEYGRCTACDGTGVKSDPPCKSGLAPHDYDTDDQGDQVDLKCRNCGHTKTK
jgi:hypothetical protein